jgi:CheY-like chemotaxis protein
MKRVFCIADKLVKELRAVNAEETAHLKKALPGAPGQFEPNVLIVEDDENDAQLSALAIRAVGGVSATIAKTGDEAIDLLNKAKAGDRPPFHICFLDLNLVGSAAQGYEVLRHIRKISPKIHVIVISGYIDQGVINFLASDKGSGGYIGIITKPLHEANLRDILAKHRMNGSDPCGDASHI